MGDYYFGKISIPLKYLREAGQELLEAISYQGLDPSRFEVDGEIATFEDDQAIDGRFDELEHELRNMGIPYDRYSSGYYEYPPEIAYFRPGTSTTEEIMIVKILTSDDSFFVPADAVRNLIDGTSDYLRRANGDIKEALQLLLNDYDPDVPPLEDWVKKSQFTDVLTRAIKACEEGVEVLDDGDSAKGLSG